MKIVKYLFFAVLSSSAISEPFGKKNIVFILADDLGWSDTAVYGSNFYSTPNIDRLAAHGVRFVNAHSSPLCSPTRASILTGRSPGRLHFTAANGHSRVERLSGKEAEVARPNLKSTVPSTVTRLNTAYKTLADTLKENGYVTAFMGKWHLGPVPYVPENFGFDEVIGGREHAGPPGSYFAPWALSTLKSAEAGVHISDFLGDSAVDFIERNRSNPFYLALWFYDVHAPFEAKPDLVKKYSESVVSDYPQKNPVMAAMIETMDLNVGKVLDKLETLDLLENTLVVFTSDNGGNMYNVIDGTFPTSNHPLRGGKGSNYEGGVRVPLIVSGPGVASTGSINEALVTSSDYFPTLLEALGLPLQPDDHMDGSSFWPALIGEEYIRGPIFSHFPHHIPATMNVSNTSVRDGDWKLYRFHFDGPKQDHRYELYNLSSDIGEEYDVAIQYPQRVKDMDALIEQEIEGAGYLRSLRNKNFKGNTVGLWRGSDNSSVEAENRSLVVYSASESGFVETDALPKVSKPAVLGLKIRKNLGGSISVGWLEKGREWKSVQVALKAGSNDISIGIPISGVLQRLKLNVGEGRTEFSNIQLFSNSGEILADYRFY